MPPAYFTTPLVTEPLPDGVNRRLAAPLRFVDDQGQLHEVPAGFVTDFASIPDLARIAAYILCSLIPASWLIEWQEWWVAFAFVAALSAFALWVAAIAHRLDADDQVDAPAVIHDYHYRVLRYNRWYSDLLLWQGLTATRRPLWKKAIIVGNVRLFGWLPWRANGRIPPATP